MTYRNIKPSRIIQSKQLIIHDPLLLHEHQITLTVINNQVCRSVIAFALPATPTTLGSGASPQNFRLVDGHLPAEQSKPSRLAILQAHLLRLHHRHP